MAQRQPFSFWISTILLSGVLCLSCAAAPQMPYHGFDSQQSLDEKDSYVFKESIGGKLDPLNLAQEDQRYAHEHIAYNRVEEGYYQWAQQLYKLGYRDVFYVRDLAPRVFKHEMLDIDDHDIAKGFEDAEEAEHPTK